MVAEAPITANAPPERPFVFFGLHMQPESSIDVFAHFFSNQERVIELISPVDSSDPCPFGQTAQERYPQLFSGEVRRLASYPGVELVSPYANTMEFLKSGYRICNPGNYRLGGSVIGKACYHVRRLTGQGVSERVDLRQDHRFACVGTQKVQQGPSRPEIVAAFSEYLALLSCVGERLERGTDRCAH